MLTVPAAIPAEPMEEAPEVCATITSARLAKLLGISERHLRRLWETGEFPHPMRLGSLLRWRRIDVQVWLDEKAAAAKRTATRQTRK